MWPKPVAYFLCAVSLALIAICPFILKANRPVAEETAPYKGILTMWHITLWRTGGSSFEAYLRKRIKEFEADYAYAFIELEALTAQEAVQALNAGDAPDLISYPLGVNPGVALQRLPSADTVLPGRHGDGWPYTCGGYCVLVSTDMLSEQSADIPENGWGLRPEALIDAAQYGIRFDAEPGCSALPALALHQYPKTGEPSHSTWGEPDPPDAMLSLAPQELESGLNAFFSENCAVLIASQRQLFEAEQAYLQGTGPAFFAYAIGGYTDMVQMIGVAACEDEKKLTACASFARYLLSNPAQRKLEPLGTLPVVSGLNLYDQDECRRAMYGLLCENAAIPHADKAQQMNALAKKALEGDEDALKQLKAMLGG